MDFEQAEALNGSIRLIAIKHRALAAAALSRLGLHPGHEAVLLALDAHGSQTQAQLARRAGCEPPSITGMVQKLQAAGLLDRHPEPWVQLACDTVAAVPAADLPHLRASLTALVQSLQSARP